MSQEEKPTCSICADTLTQEKRKLTHCPGCDIQACRECVRKYLTSETMVDDPHCMNCRIAWTQSVVYEAVGKTYVTKEMVNHRKKVLLGRQRANIPQVQEYATAKRDVSKLETELKRKQTEFRRLQRQQMLQWEREHQDECRELFRVQRIINPNYSARLLPFNLVIDGQNTGTQTIAANDRARFVHKCSGDNCEGFLSSAWKCGVCDIYTCSQCGKQCGNKPWNSPDTQHRCVPDEVETFTLVKNECKPCPNCATQIFKIAGCDQMWCTQCHTGFSWKTGAIQSRIHNPHFFEWQRQNNNGDAPRRVGDIECGRDLGDSRALMSIRKIFRSLRAYADQYELPEKVKFLKRKEFVFETIVRGTIHLDHVQSHRFRTDQIVNNQDTSYLKYLYRLPIYLIDRFHLQE